MYNIGAGSKDISPMNWGKYMIEIPSLVEGFLFANLPKSKLL